MAPPTDDWQKLLKLKLNDVVFENEEDEEQNEELGVLFTRVKIRRENFVN